MPLVRSIPAAPAQQEAASRDRDSLTVANGGAGEELAAIARLKQATGEAG